MPEVLDIKPGRSSLVLESLDETLEASASAKSATLGHLAQYPTPVEWAKFFASLLPAPAPGMVFDPQAGQGNLFQGLAYWTSKCGFEIDNRIEHDVTSNIVTCNCVKGYEVMDDVFPDLKFPCQVANPPFGLRWKVGEDTVDSTEYTWKKILERAAPKGAGYFIANHKTIERLGIDVHPWVYLYQKFPVGMFKDVSVAVGVVHWQKSPKRPEPVRLEYEELDLYEHRARLMPFLGRTAFKERADFMNDGRFTKTFTAIKDIVDDEKYSRPPFNVWLEKGKLKTYLSSRIKTKRKITREEVLRLSKLDGSHPMSLTTDVETRRLLHEFVTSGIYTIQPEAKAAIEHALKDATALACPIMPVTEFQSVAYADEEETLLCTGKAESIELTPGKRYHIQTAAYSFTQDFSREKVHYSETDKRTFTATHKCELAGKDRYIQVMDDTGRYHRFMSSPRHGNKYEHEESLLWTLFQRPVIQTIADVAPKVITKNLKVLDTCELLACYNYYPGQREYIARVAVKDSALIGADVGTGKTLMALSIIQIKSPKRALIIAPQGTMRSSEDEEGEDDEEGEEYQASQWVQEIRRFAPGLPVFELFSLEDYYNIIKANGELPGGVFISYYEAMFQNKSRENAPESWDNDKLEEECQRVMQNKKLKLPPVPEDCWREKESYWASSVGKEKNGIRCIITPCMATLIGSQFDMVCLDEAHKCCNLGTNVTQMLIRLQPRYRYAFTATPIPNVVANLFSIMGWICVPDWYKGDRRNAAWPYARSELGKFVDTFQATERDYTEEQMKRDENPKWRGRCEKISPVISSPARLLKILAPSMAYISKQACNPELVKCKVIDIRVPMGKEQSKLYAHFLNRGNIPCKHALHRARKQVAYLRNICADPAGFTHGGPKVMSNLNPKTMAILEITSQILQQGQQVVIVCARVGQSNTLQRLLTEAGVKVTRIDSTVPPDQHAANSNVFKNGKAQVMLMGIKCAMGHSFPDCPNLIVGSLEYSYGSKHQAEGRVFRVNSKRDIRIYCILHKNSYEETMFDLVATKQDSATICLLGKRVPRDFKPVDMAEVLAVSINNYKDEGVDEAEVLANWEKTKASLFSMAMAA